MCLLNNLQPVQVLSEEQTLKGLKEVGGRKALKYKEYREVRVRIGNGESIRVVSPYFVKTAAKRGRKKRGPNGSGSHVGLEVLGFVGRCSLTLVSNVVQAALLCPSCEIAESVLKRQGLKIDLKTIRRLCEELGEQGLKYRGKISLAPQDEGRFKGQTLVIGIDGGRFLVLTVYVFKGRTLMRRGNEKIMKPIRMILEAIKISKRGRAVGKISLSPSAIRVKIP